MDTELNKVYPAAYPEANILAVAATDVTGRRAELSNYGSVSIDVGAPGINIQSTTPGWYGYNTGTSMAAPHVAGVAALLLQQNPTWSATQVKDRILTTVTPVASLAGKTVSGGLLNAAAALGTGQSSTTVVDLSQKYNRVGLAPDGQTFSAAQGIDAPSGHALSATLLGSTVNYNGVPFTLGPVTPGASNVVSAAAQTLPLPTGNYAKLHILATSAWNTYTENLTVHYSSGASQVVSRTFSVWTAAQPAANEAVAQAMTYRNNADGTQGAVAVKVFAYTLDLDPTRTVASLQLPNQGKINLLALTLTTEGAPAPNPTPVQAPLGAALNRNGVTADGTGFTGGLDGNGRSYSATALGSSLVWNGLPFTFTSPGANSVARAASQTINLPQGVYSAFSFLATAVNGNQLNQTFTVTYIDGSTRVFTQSFSDWTTAAGYNNESIARAMTYRNLAGGGQDSTPVNLYGYSFVLNSAKPIKSITLPNNTNLNVLAITLMPVVGPAKSVSISAHFNRAGIMASGSYTSSGLDGTGKAYWNEKVGAGGYKGALVPWNGMAFPYGNEEPNNTLNDVVSATGQTISLPQGTYSSVSFLATAVNGDQTNQTFTVTYVGGATRTVTRSLSDWLNPPGQRPIGETVAVTSPEYITQDGTKVTQTNYLCGYSIALDISKQVQSITLPSNQNVILVAMSLMPVAPPVAQPSTTVVDLSQKYNRVGLAPDGQTFSAAQGIDAPSGHALSATLLGTTVNYNGVPFTLGPVTSGASNVVSAAAQTLPLPAGNYAKLHILATSAWNNYTENLTVHYTSGASQVVSRTFSVWTAAQPAANEAVAQAMAYRNNADGTQGAVAVKVFAYTLDLDPARTVVSLQLPNQGKINILALTLA